MPDVARLKGEFARRVEALPAELAALQRAAAANRDGAGIHRTQLMALEELVGALSARHRKAVAALPCEAGPALSDACLALVDDLVGAQEVWQIFRLALAQRRDEHLKPLVDAADLVAADCYNACMSRAEAWQALDHGIRAPPLVILEATATPSTAARGAPVATVRASLRRYRDLRLPVPLVLLPADDAACLWRYSGIHHEVGHDIDQDLALSAELRQLLLGDGSLPQDRRDQWWRWVPEVLADAIGVVLGGAGYQRFLGGWLVALAPGRRFAELEPTARHPHPLLRLRMLATMGRAMGAPSSMAAADALEAELKLLAVPAWAAAYGEDELRRVARLVLDSPLKQLKDHSVRELGSASFAGEEAKHAHLAAFLSTTVDRSDPVTRQIGYRHVPPAAQLAFSGVPPAGPAPALDVLHLRALEYLSKLRRPSFLADAPSRAFYRALADDLDFGRSAP
jgi:hypothetical protein